MEVFNGITSVVSGSRGQTANSASMLQSLQPGTLSRITVNLRNIDQRNIPSAEHVIRRTLTRGTFHPRSIESAEHLIRGTLTRGTFNPRNI